MRIYCSKHHRILHLSKQQRLGLAVWYNYKVIDYEIKNLKILQTASLGIFAGLHVDIPNAKSLPSPKDEWIVILGGSTSVGKFAVQVCQHGPWVKFHN